jgi:uncharacterized protein with HEPN domain
MHPSEIEFLRHIIEECKYLISEYQENTFDEFIENGRLCRAICRSLEIVGEASSKIGPDTRAEFPNIPWREMSDIRNKIIHQYFGVDYEIVWNTIKTDIPALLDQINLIVDGAD